MWSSASGGIRTALVLSLRNNVTGLRGVTQAASWPAGDRLALQTCGARLTQPPPSPLYTASATRLFHKTVPVCSESAVVEDKGERDRLYSLVEVECRGHETAVLQSYLTFLTTAAAHLGIEVKDVKWPKKHLQRWTLLKAVHVQKKHRVQYETRTHFLTLGLPRLTQSTADTFLEYIQRNLPEGISMKVTKHELQTLPPHVKPSSHVVPQQ
ncbi:hypothetical protein Pmani_028363 [Petrolisthes manimaculis]|uniref:Small ribosomal subunit protein uS10m n=1 Tax=Petrolisthes manimaculis TaxID=1843537 RepID=A0AAE1NZN3_9EUCA|nr:hypothetical protein Pmani_028363 [Petrolisthes manimaculis]